MPRSRRGSYAGSGGTSSSTGCTTVPLCNPNCWGFPPRCSPPLSLINSESSGSTRNGPGREAGPLTARTGLYNLALRERGVEGRVAAAEPPSIWALDSGIPGFLFPQGQSLLLLVLNYYLSSICRGMHLARTLSPMELPSEGV